MEQSDNVLSILNKLGPLYHSYFGLHPDEDGEHINYEQDDETIIYNYKELINESLTEVPFDTIIIMYDESIWTEKPYEWYNEPSKWWKGYLEYLKPFVLPYLNTCKYINIIDPFMKVSINKNDKGSPLTINDILFATRALMNDDCRSIDQGYKILKMSESTLVLVPEIDNWST
jgi:hypothetical protein